MTMFSRFTIASAAALAGAALLSACTSEPERSANDDRDAGGEVLEGTISDEMIQLDQLRSQGEPMEEVDETAGDDDAAGGASATPADADAPDSAQTAEPAEPALVD